MSFSKLVLLLAWGFIFLISISAFSKLIDIDYNAFLIPFLHPIIFFLTMHKVLVEFLNDKVWFTLENIHLFFLYIMLGFGSISYIIFLEQDLATHFHFSSTVANKSISLVLIGIVVYRITSHFFKINLPYTFEFPTISKKPIYLIFIFTIFLKVLLFAFGGASYGASFIQQSGTNISPIFTYLNYISQLNLYVLAILSFYFFSAKGEFFSKKIFYIFVTISFLLSLSTGYKEDLLDVVFAILVPYSILQISRNTIFFIEKKYFIGMMAFLLFFAMAFPILRYFYFIVRFSPYNPFDLLMSMDSDSF